MSEVCQASEHGTSHPVRVPPIPTGVAVPPIPTDVAVPPIPTDVAVPAGASVCVLQGFYEGLELAVDRPWWVIGRGRGADAVLSEATISRAHAAIGFEPGRGFFIQDLGSTNGTLVNGTRAERARPRARSKATSRGTPPITAA
jgi:hypothetical protein